FTVAIPATLLSSAVLLFPILLFDRYRDHIDLHSFPTRRSSDLNGMRLIQHRNPYPVTNADHVGGRENSYRNNWVVSKYFVPVGKGRASICISRRQLVHLMVRPPVLC